MLLIVAVPFAVVGACGVALSERVCGGGFRGTARNQAFELAKIASLFKLTAHRWPTSTDELVRPPWGVSALLPEAIRDPWGNAFRFVGPPLRSDVLDVVSAGPDGVFFTGDDLGNWSEAEAP